MNKMPFGFVLKTAKEISICGKCRFINKQQCMNPFSFSFNERVLNEYVSCVQFDRRPDGPMDCTNCHLEGNCPMTPDTCPGAVSKKEVELITQDNSPMGRILQEIIGQLKR